MTGSDLVTAARHVLDAWSGRPPTPSRPGSDRARVVNPLGLTAVGWATVEFDRAARELETGLGLDATVWQAATRETLLGASAWLGPNLGPERGSKPGPGIRLLILEPDTEGRLAASLARFGEGIAAIYVTAAGGGQPGGPSGTAGDSALDLRRAGVATSRIEVGPLGPARLLLGGPIWGPHVVRLERTGDPEAPSSTEMPTADSLPSAGD